MAADDLKSALDRLQTSLSEVKRQYEFFFLGTRKTEPISERRALEETIRKFGQRRIPNTIEQFRFNSLQSSFYTLSNLWARIVRDIEEGRLGRDTAGALARSTSTPGTAPADSPADSPAEGPVDPAHVDQVVARFLIVRRECGIPTGDQDAAAIRETLLSKAREIAAASGDGKYVEFKILLEDGRPKIKAVTR